LLDGFEAWPQGIPIRLCKKVYGVHMVFGNEEKLFKVVLNYRQENSHLPSIF
jgi:hypothetical protein